MLGDKGASSPKSPLKARSKSLSARRFEIKPGTSRVRLANSGMTRLSKRPATQCQSPLLALAVAIATRGVHFPDDAHSFFVPAAHSLHLPAVPVHTTGSVLAPTTPDVQSRLLTPHFAQCSSCSWRSDSFLSGPSAQVFDFTRKDNHCPCYLHTFRE